MKKTLKHLILVCVLALVSQASFGQNANTAKLHYDSGLLDKAQTSIEKALANEKQAAKAKTWYVRGLIYAAIAIDQTGLYGGLDDNPVVKAKESYDKALEILGTQEKPEKGVKEDTEAAQKNLFAIAINYGANKFNEIGGQEGAETALKSFVLSQELDPTNPMGYAYSADIGYNLQKMDVVIPAIEKLLALDIKNDSLFSKSGVARYYAIYAFHLNNDLDDKEKALEVAKEGVAESDPEKDPETYAKLQRLMVTLYIELEQWDEAITNLNAVAEKDPSADNFFNLGRLYENQQEEEKAIENYKKSIDAEANYNALYNLAAIYFNKGVEIKKEVDQMDIDQYNKNGKEVEAKANAEFEKALPYFEQARGLDLDDAQKENVLGPLIQLYKVFKDTEKAKQAEAEFNDLIGE